MTADEYHLHARQLVRVVRAEARSRWQIDDLERLDHEAWAQLPPSERESMQVVRDWVARVCEERRLALPVRVEGSDAVAFERDPAGRVDGEVRRMMDVLQRLGGEPLTPGATAFWCLDLKNGRRYDLALVYERICDRLEALEEGRVADFVRERQREREAEAQREAERAAESERRLARERELRALGLDVHGARMIARRGLSDAEIRTTSDLDLMEQQHWTVKRLRLVRAVFPYAARTDEPSAS